MRHFGQRLWREDAGVLTFEWILLITVLVIGIVGGLSAVRDATITELGDVVEGVISLDQSYSISAPWEIRVPDCGAGSVAAGSGYQDRAGMAQGRSPVQSQQGGIQEGSDTVEEPLPQP